MKTKIYSLLLAFASFLCFHKLGLTLQLQQQHLMSTEH